MFVVEQYYKMRKEKKADEIKIMRLSKQVTTQEKIISELQRFIHDTLSEIFSTVEKHKPQIIEERRNFLMPVDTLA